MQRIRGFDARRGTSAAKEVAFSPSACPSSAGRLAISLIAADVLENPDTKDEAGRGNNRYLSPALAFPAPPH